MYSAIVGTRRYQVACQQSTRQREAILDTIPYAIDWRQVATLATKNAVGGSFHCIIAGRSYEIYARLVTADDAEGWSRYEITLDGQSFEVTVENERTHSLAKAIQTGPQIKNTRITAPMPGLIVALPHPTGSEITMGETVVIIEAMKMENDLVSPITGIIKETLVRVGQSVEQNQPLLILEQRSQPQQAE